MQPIEEIILTVNYIEANLTRKIDLDMIAQAVHYSKYHLHRVFSHTVGLTIHDYIQRRQLTEAGKLLVFSEKSIVEIALLSGYQSQQAFTNAFTSMYKIPPNKYREKEKFYPLQLKFEFDGRYDMLKRPENRAWDIRYATKEDIPAWLSQLAGGYVHGGAETADTHKPGADRKGRGDCCGNFAVFLGHREH